MENEILALSENAHPRFVIAKGTEMRLQALG